MSRSQFFTNGSEDGAMVLPCDRISDKGDEGILNDITSMRGKPKVWAKVWNPIRRKELNIIAEECTHEKNINWESIAMKLGPQYSSVNCRLLYENDNDMNVWTDYNTKALAELVNQYGENNWSKISVELDIGKSPIQCLCHYQRNINPLMRNSDPWTDEERQRMREHLVRLGAQNPVQLRCLFPGRDPNMIFSEYQKQCRRASAVTGRWREEQERKLLLAAIAYRSYLTTSSSTADNNIPLVDTLVESDESEADDDQPPVSNPINTTTSAEDELDKKIRSNVWKLIANQVVGKDHAMCKEKWMYRLDPSIVVNVSNADNSQGDDHIATEPVSRKRKAASSSTTSSSK